jgi:nucleotide-binding universal stress UspA family protein
VKRVRAALQNFKIIGIAFDGSEFAIRALKVAEAMARRFDAELLILQVVPARSYIFESPGMTSAAVAAVAEAADGARKSAQKEIHGIVKAISEGGVRVKGEVFFGRASVVEELAQCIARENVSLLVVGRRGLGSLRRFFFGSVSEGLIDRVGCPVLVVK